jgi:hypothetical protein
MSDMILAISDFQRQLNEYRTLINQWNSQTLDPKDLEILLEMFDKIAFETKTYTKSFNSLKTYHMNINEIFLQHRDEIASTSDLTQSSIEYQKDTSKLIEAQFYEKRVRGIHFRNQPIRVHKKYTDGIQRIIGYDQDKDFP